MVLLLFGLTLAGCLEDAPEPQEEPPLMPEIHEPEPGPFDGDYEYERFDPSFIQADPNASWETLQTPGNSPGFVLVTPANETIELSINKCHEEHPEWSKGRAEWITIWNRTGRALEYENIKTCTESTAKIEWPPDPPYRVRGGTAFPPGIEITYQKPYEHGFRKLCNYWSSTCENGEISWSNQDISKRNGSLEFFSLTIPVGSVRAESTITIPAGIGNLNMAWGSPVNTSEMKYRLYDPLGRESLAFNYSGIFGNELRHWGPTGLAGNWTWTLEIPFPTYREVSGSIGFVWYQVTPAAYKLGFDWPPHYYDRISATNATVIESR